MENQVESIFNFYALSDSIGSSGQPDAAEFGLIRDAGYRVIVNLAPPQAEMALANEREIVTALGLEYIPIPVLWDAPQESDIKLFFQAMQLYRDQKIFVHCEVNYRASSFLYLYRRKYLGIDEKQARQDLLWLWEPNETWRKFIDGISALP